MKFLFRWLFRLLILAIVLAVGALLLKDTILKAIAETRLRQSLGLEVRIGRMEVGLLTPTVSIERLRVFNLPEFGGSPLLDIPELHLEYDRDAARQGVVRLKLLRLNAAELNIVRNAAGHTNLVGLIALMQHPETAAQRPAAQRPESAAFGGIQTLNLSLGKITFTDLRPPTLTREFRLDVRNEVTTDLKSELDILSVLARALLRRGITLVELPSGPASAPGR
jgi:hypothetical protein